MSKIARVIANAIYDVKQGVIDSYDNLLKQLKLGLDEVEVKVWREDDTVKLPTYAKPGDACMDVYVHSIEYKDDGRVVYHTGLHFKLPEDYEMEIRPRSSMTKTCATMQNSPGTLDEGYTGELLIVHRDLCEPEEPYEYYKVGDCCAQIIVRRRERIIWNEVKTKEDLGTTERGDGGFGSTNK